MNAPANLPQRGREIAALAERIREMCGDDDLAFVDTLDGETDAIQAARAAVRMIASMEAMEGAAKVLKDRYGARASDFASRGQRTRGALLQFLTEIGEKTLVLPEGTISVRAGSRSTVGDGVEGLPADLVRIKREPDKTAIKAALERGDEVPGYSLSNASPTLALKK